MKANGKIIVLFCCVCCGLVTYYITCSDITFSNIRFSNIGEYFLIGTEMNATENLKSVIKPCPDHKRILTVQAKGNLGNLIWEYMSLYVVYKMYVEDEFLPYIEKSMKEKLENVFEELSLPTSYFVDRASPVKVIRREQPVSDWASNDNCSSMLLEEYSARYEDIIKFDVDNIRQELRFKKNLTEVTMNTMNEARKELYPNKDNVTFVGVHYRGTDYVHHLLFYHGNVFKGPPDYHYYVQAMNYFKDNYDNVIFFLISIDYPWLKENESYIRNNSKVITNPYHDDPVKDLILLSHCNHTIINYGTYGATAGFFTKGTTIVYDLHLPLDHRGQTVAMGISKILDNWFMLPYNSSNSVT